MSERTPDVTVVIPVYNTRTYLAACLDSIISQSIGTDRIEVIAVDDGSTDGSGELLDQFAADYPDTVTVVHQANSGGPAEPCNAGLDLARGRFVFFIGSDDYFGHEALERMVERADALESDVLLCKMVGVNGRKAPDVFEEDVDDVAFPSAEMAWALSNTKLFRRSLIEDEELRFPVGMAVCSDVPFTLRALAKARRISILADYDCYFAVKREGGGNLIYSTGPVEWVDAAERIVAVVEDLYGPGPDRDALVYRVFSREVAKGLQPHFLEADAAIREKFWESISGFAQAHLTDAILEQLPTEKRVRISLARHRDWQRLEAAIDAAAPGFLVEDGRLFVRYPGFRDGSGLPDSWYEAATERVLGRLDKGVAPIDLAWAGDRRTGYFLECWFGVPVTGLDAAAIRVGAVRLEGRRKPAKRAVAQAGEPLDLDLAADVELREDGTTTVVMARLPLADLHAARTGRWSLRGHLSLGGYTYDLPLKAVNGPVEHYGRPGGLSVTWARSRALVVEADRPTIARRLRRIAKLVLSRK